MKSRIIWGAVLLAAFAAFYFVTIRPTMTPYASAPKGPPSSRMPLTDGRTTFPLPPELMTATIPIPAVPTPAMPSILVEPPALKMEVPIQHGATIDFSLGSPVVRSGGEDQAALERALKEMAEATKDVKFSPKE